MHIYFYSLHGDAPLYFAIRCGCDKIVEVLTKLGADVNHVNELSYHHSVL